MRRVETILGLTAGLLCLAASPAWAGKVAVWRQSGKADFERAKLDGVVVGAGGEVTLGRAVEEVGDLSAGMVWDLARSPKGAFVAACGLPGTVVEFEPGGAPRTLWKHDERQALSVVALADGSILFGSGPTGLVQRISPEGEVTDFFQTEALYVWDLVATADGRVYAATGPEGRIYAIDAQGQGRVLYDSPQPHVLCLAMADDGRLLAGTDGAGWIVSIAPQGQARVLYDTAENEVRSLAVLADGRVVAGTAATADADRDRPPAIETSANPAMAGKNSVYVIDPRGNATAVWQAETLVYALIPGGEDEVLAATRSPSAVTSISLADRRARELARFDAASALCLARTERGDTLLGCGNPGKVYSLTQGHRTSGTLVSSVLDAKLNAQFGALDWRAEQPAGSQVSIAARSGNTAEPDETWSGWSAEQTEPTAAQAKCPPGRFLQYRLTLSTSDPATTPTVRTVSARYQTANQPPKLEKLAVPHMEEGDGRSTIEKLKIKWEAADPNGDDLTYRIAYRKADWPSAVVIESDHRSTEFDWDVTTAPEGVYRLEVTASDRTSNAPDESLESVVVSEPFVVDRTAPRLELHLGEPGDARQRKMTIEAADALCPLVAAEYSLDSGRWTPLFSADGLADSISERFELLLPELTAGSHVLVVRVTDAAGHTGTADTTIDGP